MNIRPLDDGPWANGWKNRRRELAMQHAASTASLLLTTEAVISRIPEQNQNAAMSTGGLGDGMY